MKNAGGEFTGPEKMAMLRRHLADINDDAAINELDVEPFLGLLFGP